MIYDITPPVSPKLSVFPGDTPLSREVLMDTANGDNITLSTMRSTVHLGAHADAPSHYGPSGHANVRTIEQQPVEHYFGPCQVVEAKLAPRSRVRIDDLSHQPSESRVLIKTESYPDPNTWSDDFCGLDPSLVGALADRGVVLIGIDTPSVDIADSKDLPAHAAFLENDVAILEGLVLAHVPAGRYELIALPLRLVGFDASPVRAVLRPLSE